MKDWQYTEVLTTFRDYQSLLNQASFVLITATGILTFKNRRLNKRCISISLSLCAFITGVACVLLGFQFRSRLIDVVLGITPENPASLTDEALKCLTLWQVGLLVLGAILLTIAAAITPRDRSQNGQ